MPGRDRDGRGVPPPHLSPSAPPPCCWQPPHRWGPNPACPTPSLGHGWDPTSPSSALQGPAIACHASLRSRLSPSRGAGPRAASATAKQPGDGATGVTAASALPPGGRLHRVPAPGMLWSCCKHWEPQESRAQAPLPAWQKQGEERPHFCREMHVVILGYLEPI